MNRFAIASLLCLSQLGCSRAKIVPTPILKEHLIQIATEELDEWLHDHCKYIGTMRGIEKARSWANNTHVNVLEIVGEHEGAMQDEQSFVGFQCEKMPPKTF
jgi:hypothetical protein